MVKNAYNGDPAEPPNTEENRQIRTRKVTACWFGAPQNIVLVFRSVTGEAYVVNLVEMPIQTETVWSWA